MSRTDSNYDVTSNTKVYYKLNETTGTSVADSSGNGHTGTATDISWVAGKFGNAASFNGTTSKIDCGNIALNISNITFSFWLDGSTTGNRAIILKDGSPSAGTRNTDITCINSIGQGLFAAFFTTDSTLSNAYSTTLLPSGMVHCVITRDSSGVIEFYYNGIKQPKIQTATASGTLQSTSSVLTLGYTTIGYSSLNTKIDEVIIESTARTAQQVLDYYNKSQERYLGEYLGAGPTVTKGLYHLNGDANDSSGNGNNGTATNVAYSLGSGKFGQGCNLTAQGGISIPATTMGTIGTGDFTISGWYNLAQPAAGVYPMLFGSFASSSPFAGPTIFYNPLGVDGAGSTSDSIIFRNVSTNLLVITSPSGSSLYGKRTNIIMVRRSGVIYAYINGTLVGQVNDTTNIPSAGNAYIFSRNEAVQTQPTTAKGDEIILENRARTQTEIQKYYTYAKGRFGIL